MSGFLSVNWAAALLTLVICTTAQQGGNFVSLRKQLHDTNRRLSQLEKAFAQMLSYKSDYGEFVKQDGWVLVFRGTSGLGSSVYNAWTRAGYHDDYKNIRATMPCGCTSTNGSCDRHYRSRLLDSWPSSALDKVKLAVYEGGVEKAYVVFTGLGSNYMNWFSADRLVESSWKDLKTSAHNFFSIAGFTGGAIRRFYVSNFHGGCPGDIGWLNIKESNDSCPWEESQRVPAFVYSKSDTMINWQNAGDLRGFADVMAVWVKFRNSVNLTQSCMP